MLEDEQECNYEISTMILSSVSQSRSVPPQRITFSAKRIPITSRHLLLGMITDVIVSVTLCICNDLCTINPPTTSVLPRLCHKAEDSGVPSGLR